MSIDAEVLNAKVVESLCDMTLEHGVRVNRTGETTLRTGGILAVGDSFTAGSEVHDHESWPAQLERMLKKPTCGAQLVTWNVSALA